MMAKYRAEDTVKAWNSMSDKERGRTMAMWHEWKAEKKDDENGH